MRAAGNARDDRRRQGPQGRLRGRPGRRFADQGRRDPRARRMDERRRRPRAARTGQVGRRQVQDPGTARLHPHRPAARPPGRPAAGHVPRGLRPVRTRRREAARPGGAGPDSFGRALAMVLPHLESPSLKATAGTAAVSIGEKIVGPAPPRSPRPSNRCSSRGPTPSSKIVPRSSPIGPPKRRNDGGP